LLNQEEVAPLLADKRSENTKRAYAKDLQNFFLTTLVQQPTPALVSQFLQLGRFEAISDCVAVQGNFNGARVIGDKLRKRGNCQGWYLDRSKIVRNSV